MTQRFFKESPVFFVILEEKKTFQTISIPWHIKWRTTYSFPFASRNITEAPRKFLPLTYIDNAAAFSYNLDKNVNEKIDHPRVKNPVIFCGFLPDLLWLCRNRHDSPWKTRTWAWWLNRSRRAVVMEGLQNISDHRENSILEVISRLRRSYRSKQNGKRMSFPGLRETYPSSSILTRSKWLHGECPCGHGRDQPNPVGKGWITDWKVACLSRFQVYMHFLHRVCGGTTSSFHSTGTNHKMDKPTNGTTKPRDGWPIS